MGALAGALFLKRRKDKKDKKKDREPTPAAAPAALDLGAEDDVVRRRRAAGVATGPRRGASILTQGSAPGVLG